MSRPRWLQGPAFLLSPPDEWPALDLVSPVDDSDPEVKTQAASFATTEERDGGPVEKLIAHYSNWTRLLHATAGFLVVAEVKLRGAKPITSLQPEHLQKAEEALFTHIQGRHFIEEVAALLRGQRVPPASPVSRFRPRLQGRLMVATGRLTHASLPAETKCPIILPSQHPAVKTLVRHVHERIGSCRKRVRSSRVKTALLHTWSSHTGEEGPERLCRLPQESGAALCPARSRPAHR